MGFVLRKNRVIPVKILCFALFFFFLLIFFINNSYSNITRPTTFDERPECEKSNGVWRDFGNSCADKCEYKYQKYPYCSNGINYSCDCGKNSCLYEDKCIDIKQYKNIYDSQNTAEQKILEANKFKRLKKYKKFQVDYINKLSGIYNVDPNYRDPYYYLRQRELPANVFRSNNRMLIYNDIIKKRNDKILLIQKKYQDELDLMEKNGSADKSKIDMLRNQLRKANNMTIIQPMTDSNLLNQNSNADDGQDNKDEVLKNNVKNQPVLLKPINQQDEELSKNNQNNNNLIQKIINKTDDIILKNNNNDNLFSSNSSDNKGDSKDAIIDSNNQIPPVYIKQQNGESDFKNGEVIDNSNDFPQFVN